MTLDTIPDTNRETNEVIAALAAVEAAIQGLPAALAAIRPGQFDLTTAPQVVHTKIRGNRLILNGDAAGTVTMRVGTRAYLFTLTATDLYRDIPFPRLIERGTDIFIIFGGGVTACTAYLTYTPE